jgi:hypothetical protein
MRLLADMVDRGDCLTIVGAAQLLFTAQRDFAALGLVVVPLDQALPCAKVGRWLARERAAAALKNFLRQIDWATPDELSARVSCGETHSSSRVNGGIEWQKIQNTVSMK